MTYYLFDTRIIDQKFPVRSIRHSIPFQNGVELKLVGHNTPCGRTKIVLGLGEEGAPDDSHVVYYGAVHQAGDELYMWYLGQNCQETGWFERVCFAKSKDGYHWERPNLGLVEYRGNRNNNLVDLNQGSHHVQSYVVFYEPDDPDPQRRFKMVFQTRYYKSVFAAAYSADGLTWRESPNNPVGRWFEMAGGARFNGCYYLTGQGGNHAGGLRQLVTYASYDFEHWLAASCWGMRRSNLAPQPAGALFDYLLDDEGAFVTEHKPHMKKELGIISVGFNTIELLAVRDKATVQRFTNGSTVGVRRLIELLNRDNHYSLGELDALLRSHALDVSDVLPLWAREVNGVIERRWGQQWRRFERIIVVDGGALLLGDYLIGRFGDKTYLPDQPVLATARGLYKQALAQMARQRGD